MMNFKALKVWQKGFDIAVNSYELVKNFPNNETFTLSRQITRAAVSISSNIAEGSSRTSEKEYVRFLEISLGSSFELETQYLLAKAIGIGNTDLIQRGLKLLNEEQKMIIAFIKKINIKNS